MSHAHKHVAPTISAKRWQYLKGLGLGPGRMLHKSAEVAMIPHPTNPMIPPTPWIQKPGETYNVGRNKAKRERRLVQSISRAVEVAQRAMA